MNRTLAFVCLGLLPFWPLAAQTSPARLGIVLAHPEAAVAGDLLTAELSRRNDVQLLERADIDKVFREQALSAQNSDFIKLGRILGADGLLELDVVQSGGQTTLSARLMAVKPGAVLLARSFSWANPQPAAAIPLSDWAPLFVKQVVPLLPKLLVLDKDAIPVSVLNLRSAVQSVAGLEEERAIKLLTIERLSREPRLFVLERQRLGSLSEEKDLKSDNSPFWNGSYLLDGALDATGYSAPAIAVSARLTPPKGGAPVLIEVSGSRTNLEQVANQLAARIITALQLNPAAVECNPTNEASQFLSESQWALKWKLYPQAQGAAESAWTLGRHDMECAEARVRSYMLPIERPKNSVASFSLDDFAASALEKPPTAGEADCAQRALELYLQFSQTLDTNEVKSDSRWVRLGVEALISASHHLQRFWRASETQETLADTAAGLRASARSVAKWLASLPSERKTFCFGDRILTSDDVMRDFSDNLNIFRCELNWGSFWQERPEDTLALYRELMTHPRYPCIHQDLWFRLNARPRLVSWNRATAALQPALWDSFIHDLNASTNAYIVMEAKALALADAVSSRGVNDNRTLDAGVAFFDYVIGNYDSIIAANEQLLYLNWQLDRFGARWGFYGTGIGTGHKYRWDVVWGFYLSANTNAPGGQVSQEDQYNYAPRLLALRDDYTKRNSEKIKELATAEMFEEQKAFLAASRPYDFIKFTDLFNKRDCYHKQMDYSQAQAAQLLPLIQAYKSNIIARAAGGSQQEKFKAAHNAGWVGAMLEYRVREILNAPTAVPPVRAFQSKGVPPESTEPQKPDNILLVTDFHPLPKDSLAANDFAGTFDHSWNEGRLLLGLQHNSSQNPAVAIFDPQHDNWAIVKYTNRPDAAQPPEYLPNIVTSTLRVEAMDRFGPGGAPFALLDDHLYLSVNGRFNQYDFHTRQWTALNLPGIQNARLFVVNQRLYAANSESIFEITRQGRTARLLAGTRRRPAQSLLDTMDKFKDPVLFAGPNQSLRAALDDNWVYSWNGSDWHKEFSAIGTANPAGEGMFFRSERGVWLLGDNGAAPQWCFDNQWRTKNYFRWSPGANARAKPKQRMFDSGGSRELASETPTLWVCPFEEFLTYLPGTAYQSNLYFLVDHSPWAARDGYDVKLVCLLRGDGNPKFVPLKFASSAGASFSLPPASGSLQDTWLQFVGDRLIISLGGSPGVWTIPVANLPSNPPDDRGT